MVHRKDDKVEPLTGTARRSDVCEPGSSHKLPD
jgi:hypothetical protein